MCNRWLMQINKTITNKLAFSVMAYIKYNIKYFVFSLISSLIEHLSTDIYLRTDFRELESAFA